MSDGPLELPRWSPVKPRDWVNVRGRIVTKSLVACETNAWSLVSVPRDPKGRPDPGGQVAVAPFRCGSWRCRVCGPKVGARDFVRVAAAAVSRPRWYYAVLTFDPSDWEDRWAAFTGFYSIFRNRLRKRIARMGGGRGKLEYVMTFERHASGWPHVNLLMSMPGLDDLSDSVGVERRRAGKRRDGRMCLLPKWRSRLVKAAGDSGLGSRGLWLEQVADPEAMSSYLTKTALELVGGGAKGQTPYGAPKGFRRLRSTRGTLPPTFASIKRSSGELPERAWAMTSEYSVRDWSDMPELEFRARSQSAFRAGCSAREDALLDEARSEQKALASIERAFAGEVDWLNLATGWADELREVKEWNEHIERTRTASGG